MKRRWFSPWGWIYRPVSWQAFIILALAAAFCLQVFLAVDRQSHSVSDTLYAAFPYVVSTLTLTTWVASKTSGFGREDG
jgi:ABC-type tungstate transport system substrate-binding protein